MDASFIDYAVELERIGFDDVIDSEHVLFTRDMRPPCSTGNMVLGRDPQRSDRADTLVALATIAARTTRLTLASATLLMTSAPSAASWAPAAGPATRVADCTTRMPASTPPSEGVISLQ